jgi:hypothetical protein
LGQIGQVNCTRLLFPTVFPTFPSTATPLYLSINQFCQATLFFKTTQFLIQSYHPKKKEKKGKKNFCKTQNGGITSSLDVVGS